MRDFRDAKAMARTLREELAKAGTAVSHGECLELVSRQFQFDSWNVLAARMGRDEVRLDPAIPIIRIFSVDRAEEFYVGWLGFTVDWVHNADGPGPRYLQLSRNGLTLHLSEHHGDGTPGGTTFVWMQGIDALLQELNAKPYEFLIPGIVDMDFGRVMHLTDPFGNRLRLSERWPGNAPPG